MRRQPRPDGEVEIIGSGRLSQSEAAVLITEIAQAAGLAHPSLDADNWVQGGRFDRLYPAKSPSASFLGEPKKDYSLLTLHFGAAVIGIPIPNTEGRKLSQVLMAASADEIARH